MSYIHICVANTEFECPYCGKEYSDSNDKYVKRLNKIKRNYLIIKCDCSNKFGMCYDYTGTAIAFKLED